VPAGAFVPRPKVDSAVLQLEPLATPAISDDSRRGFRRLVVGIFGFRRKQLLRGIRELTGWGPDLATAVLARAALDGAERPERLTVAQFAALLAALVDAGWVGD
jgi:16S rRNA (adenine1518-N6/adenine1519-N6)-dimethyltransferase